MNRWAGLALLLLAAALFSIANRGAYRSYFQDDEIENISWAPLTSHAEFLKYLVTPRFVGNNFRPVGHYYFHLAGGAFGLDFPKYIPWIHVLHLVTVVLLWMLLRKLGFAVPPSLAGCGFFAFHMALFDAYWKPMYVFDILCALFCFASILLYLNKRWVWSFVAFWVAYKSKELAVMLPAVLLAHELWLGERRWKRLIPFFLVSLSFGIQGILMNPNVNNEYTFRFTPKALVTSVPFYASQILLVPFGGFLLLAVPFFVKDRRAWLGLAAMGLFFVPLLFLPGRLYAVYCYLPLTGAAVVLATLAAQGSRWISILFLAAWLPANMLLLREIRKTALAQAHENRSYIQAIGEFTKSAPAIPMFVFDGAPDGFHRWGVEGTLRWFYRNQNIQAYPADDRDVAVAFKSPSLAVLSWDNRFQKLSTAVRAPGRPSASYIEMNRTMPLWQLGRGWYRLEGYYRWAQPWAAAELRWPADARQFELKVNIGPAQIRTAGRVQVELALNGEDQGKREFTAAGVQAVRWDLKHPGPENALVEFRIQPEFRLRSDPRNFGAAVVAFGFLPKETQ